MIFEAISQEGFTFLENSAKDKIQKLTDQLVDPKIAPSLQKVEDDIALRYEIKGINWWLEQVESIRKKEKEV